MISSFLTNDPLLIVSIIVEVVLGFNITILSASVLPRIVKKYVFFCEENSCALTDIISSLVTTSETLLSASSPPIRPEKIQRMTTIKITKAEI